MSNGDNTAGVSDDDNMTGQPGEDMRQVPVQSSIMAPSREGITTSATVLRLEHLKKMKSTLFDKCTCNINSS